MSVLDRIVAVTRERIERDKKAGIPTPKAKKRCPFRFEQSLRQPGLSFICEVKKASPSKGILVESFSCRDLARDYAEAGADAISVLTEPDFFQGQDWHLQEINETVELPLLRKDFIIDPFQIEQSACLGADAILLICAILQAEQLADYLRRADALDLSCLVEVHDAEELKMALRAGARVVGINNRDLKNFTVDLGTCLRLQALVPPEVLSVAESGIQTALEVQLLREKGIDAVLIGETLVRAADRKSTLAQLRGS